MDGDPQEMPQIFPLIVTFTQKYRRHMGIGSLLSVTLPYTLGLMSVWTVCLLIYWSLGLPLGLGAVCVYPAS